MFILEENEIVVKVVRKHWFAVLSSVVRSLLIAIIPIVVYKLVTSSLLNIGINKIIQGLGNWVGFSYSLYLLLVWVMFFVDWTDFYLDMLLITDRRVMNINQNGFFRREVISFRFEQIQDVTVETRGILQTFFKYGLIQVQTAGEKRCIIIKNADNPEEVRSIILDKQMGRKPSV